MLKRLKIASVIVLLSFVSCSKEKDEIKPTIDVVLPSHGREVDGIDTIQILANISDDKNIESVQVSLRNTNDIPVLSSIIENPNQTDYALNASYFFDDIHLPSGSYYFNIKASDGENVTTKHVDILYNEVGRSRKGIFIFSNSGSIPTIELLNNGFNASSFTHSVSGDHLVGAINSRDQLLYYVSKTSGAFNALNLITGSSEWNIPIINSSSSPYYLGFLFDMETLYLSGRDGAVKGYNESGSIVFQANATGGYQIESMLAHNHQYFIAEQRPISPGFTRINSYWLDSGAPTGTNSSIGMNENIKGMFSKSANEVIVILENGDIIYYNPVNGTFTAFQTNVGLIDDCCEMGVGVYLLIHGGDVFLIQTNSVYPFSTPTPFITGSNVDRVWFDNHSGELFLSSGRELEVYDVNGNQVGSYTGHLADILDVAFWYNK